MAYDPPGQVNDVYQVILRAQQFGQNFQNAFYYQIKTVKLASAGAYSDLQALFQSQVWDLMRAQISTTVVNARLRVQKVFPLPKLLFRYFTPIQTTGLNAGTPLPPATSVVLRAYAAQAGPQSRGRIFMFGVTADQNSQGQIPSAAVDGWRSLAQLLFEDAMISERYEFTPVLFRAGRPNANPPVVSWTQPIVASDVNIVLRQQRRREIGVGE